MHLSLLRFRNSVLCGGGECYGDLQLASLTKGRHVLVDLPGSLEDQLDPVHLFRLGHPASERKDK